MCEGVVRAGGGKIRQRVPKFEDGVLRIGVDGGNVSRQEFGDKRRGSSRRGSNPCSYPATALLPNLVQLPAATIAIRPPTPPELVRLREWMPLAFRGKVDLFWHVAVLGRHARIVGAAAVLLPPDGSARLLWQVIGEVAGRADVLPPLFTAALDSARTRGAACLRTANMVEEGSTAGTLLQSLGFEVVGKQEVFEISTAALHAYLEPLYRQLVERGRIPADARVESLRDEFLPAARALFARHLPNHDGPADAVLARDEEGYRQSESYALLVGGEVRGVVLRRKDGAVSHTGAILVARALRGGSGWAHLMLLYWGNVHSMADGTETGRFTADAHLHRNTLNFARHLKIPRVGCRGYYQSNLREKMI